MSEVEDKKDSLNKIVAMSFYFASISVVAGLCISYIYNDNKKTIFNEKPKISEKIILDVNNNGLDEEFYIIKDNGKVDTTYTKIDGIFVNDYLK
jgi:hypothetical protein